MSNLIQPVQHGEELLQDIATTEVSNRELAMWWLGQSGYVFKSASTTFYVDLYLSEHLTHKYADSAKPHVRMTAAPLRGHDLQAVGYVFASHKHSDHLDPGTLPDVFTNSPEARLVLPAAHVAHVVAMGIDESRLIPVRGDDQLVLGSLTVDVIPSAHPDLSYTDAYGYPCVGFIFHIDGVTVYHSGDTVVYDGLIERLEAHDVDVAFLPINGTDEQRMQLKVPPNMGVRDAIATAQAAKIKLLIPHHYDMFTFNTVDVNEFVEKVKHTAQEYRILQCGEKFIYKK